MMAQYKQLFGIGICIAVCALISLTVVIVSEVAPKAEFKGPIR